MEAIEQFDLHYYLRGDSHSMNALVRNKCEREFLAAAYEIAATLKIPLEIESFAHSEGGLKERWKALGKNSGQLSLILTVIALYFSIYPPTDKELTGLEKEAKQLEIEKSKLEIQRLRREAAETNGQDEELAGSIAESLQSNGNIAVRRSNYYKLLDGYDMVEAVGYHPNPNEPNPAPEIKVERPLFSRFILRSDKLPVEVDDNAIVEIFAPVLVNGKYHWRGKYQGKIISFSMTDPKFKRSILNKDIHFQNGTKLRCVLNSFRKYNQLGEVVVTGYSVATVLDVSEAGEAYIETDQGRSYRHVKAVIDAQHELFDDSGSAVR
ncbi:hypothetical protein ACEU0B_000310 [Stenotrophomonas indicatrix]|uniref:hypothetical protein n=1 Tax=Stenotrophomonas indicatrix TaxID=2045451 RepID=UPI00372DE30B